MAQVLGKWIGVVVVTALFVAAGPVGAQERWATLPAPVLTAVAGGFSLDDEGSASGLVGGLRVEFPLSGLIALEPGVERLSWSGDDEGSDAVRWSADLAARGGYTFGRLRPYAGGNIGILVDFDDERAPDAEFVELGWGAHGGVRAHLASRVYLLGEARARWVGDVRWLLYTVGVGVRF